MLRLADDVLDRSSRFGTKKVKQIIHNKFIEHKQYIHEHAMTCLRSAIGSGRTAVLPLKKPQVKRKSQQQ